MSDLTNIAELLGELDVKDARIAEMEAENERLTWMTDHICGRASSGTWYAQMPWTSKEDMMADLERRWAQRGKK